MQIKLKFYYIQIQQRNRIYLLLNTIKKPRDVIYSKIICTEFRSKRIMHLDHLSPSFPEKILQSSN
jgi:hypothetical protein